jgi:hypothetical protein
MLGIGVVLWLGICASALTRALNDGGKFDVAIALALIVAPIVIRSVRRLPPYLLAAYALIVPFNDLVGATGGGGSVTRLLGMVVGVCMMLSIVVNGEFVKPSRPLLALLVLTTYLGATIFWAIDPSQALTAYAAFLSWAWLFAMISLHRFSPGDFKLFLGATLLGALAQAAYGSYLFLHGQEITGTRLYIGSADQNFIDPNAFAAGLLAPLALTMVIFLRTRAGFLKLYWLAALLLLFFGFLISSSRGAAVALVLMGAFLTWRSAYRKQLAAIGVVSLIVMTTGSIGSRFMEADVANANGRAEIWKVGIASLHRYWLGGAGIGNFTEAFSQYYLAVPHIWLPWDRVAHSIFIQGAVEYGILGLIPFLAFWYLMFRDLADVRVNGLAFDICTALRASVLGLFVVGITLDLMEYKFTWLVFSLISAMRSTLLSAGIPVYKPKGDRSAEQNIIPKEVALIRTSPNRAQW